jgi:uncharacterized protein
VIPQIFFLILLLLNTLHAGGSQMTAQEVIQKLDLKPLPNEGGYYRETYRSGEEIPANGRSGNSRRASTAIYYLVTADSFSALHRVTSDEIFHFYGGNSVEMIQIDQQGNFSRSILGSNFANGEQMQVVVPAGVWQALRLIDGGAWGLMGTTVAPGFEFVDFELGERAKLIELYPQFRKEIERFTRNECGSVFE